METKVILKYKRPCDSWLCPDCDAENSMTVSRCTICDCVKTASVVIVKTWTPADDVPEVEQPIPPKKSGFGIVGGGTSGGKGYEDSKTIFKDGFDTPPLSKPASSGGSKALLIIAAIIAVIIIFAALAWGVENGYVHNSPVEPKAELAMACYEGDATYQNEFYEDVFASLEEDDYDL